MTRDEIFKLAHEAAIEDGSTSRADGKSTVLYAAKTNQFLERFAALVAAAEREALASQTVPSDCSDSHQPDAWRTEARNDFGLPVFFCASEVKQAGPGLIPLYTTSPQRQPLSNGEVWRLMRDHDPSVYEAFRLCERAHGIGGEE